MALGGAAVGTGIMAVVTTIVVAATPNDTALDIFASIVVVLLVAVIFGGVPGGLVGMIAGFIRRKIEGPREPKRGYLSIPEQPYDMWSELVERCAESTRRVAAAVRTVPKSPAKDWLQRISEQLTRELDDVRGIAQLGRALGAVDRQHPVYQRLLKAAHDFKQFEDEVGRVALQMFDHPELDEARTHLELLEKQLPQLSA